MISATEPLHSSGDPVYVEVRRAHQATGRVIDLTENTLAAAVGPDLLDVSATPYEARHADLDGPVRYRWLAVTLSCSNSKPRSALRKVLKVAAVVATLLRDEGFPRVACLQDGGVAIRLVVDASTFWPRSKTGELAWIHSGYGVVGAFVRRLMRDAGVRPDGEGEGKHPVTFDPQVYRQGALVPVACSTRRTSALYWGRLIPERVLPVHWPNMTVDEVLGFETEIAVLEPVDDDIVPELAERFSRALVAVDETPRRWPVHVYEADEIMKLAKLPGGEPPCVTSLRPGWSEAAYFTGADYGAAACLKALGQPEPALSRATDRLAAAPETFPFSTRSCTSMRAANADCQATCPLWGTLQRTLASGGQRWKVTRQVFTFPRTPSHTPEQVQAAISDEMCPFGKRAQGPFHAPAVALAVARDRGAAQCYRRERERGRGSSDHAPAGSAACSSVSR